MNNLLEKGKEMLNKSGSSGGNTAAQPGQEDYVDKGLDAFERKEGFTENRATNEKITDAARGAFEKVTGRDVPSKVSN
ncbi:hypothetical protein C8R45DRAFT_1039254 [Mycena sanguinolenta]|nr:hypothetical protein C8R45DRAFT_1039254 [Mycena sanguinolenta]